MLKTGPAALKDHFSLRLTQLVGIADQRHM